MFNEEKSQPSILQSLITAATICYTIPLEHLRMIDIHGEAVKFCVCSSVNAVASILNSIYNSFLWCSAFSIFFITTIVSVKQTDMHGG